MTYQQLQKILGDSTAHRVGSFRARGIKCDVVIWGETKDTTTISWLAKYDDVVYGTNLEVARREPYDTYIDALKSNARQVLGTVKGRYESRQSN